MLLVFFFLEKHGEADVHQDVAIYVSDPAEEVLLRLGRGPLSQIRRLLSGDIRCQIPIENHSHSIIARQFFIIVKNSQNFIKLLG